ncbi:MAG: radical SAM protein [Candidatus Firestonebacteria bacterium]
MIKIGLKIPLYKSFYRFGWPKMMPFSYTISVTFKCNSRCKTCYVWDRKSDDLTLEEFDRTFNSLGSSPYWVTISGGEPFIRKDITEIIKSLYRRCRPKVINIPTNGILSDIIPVKAEEMVRSCPDSRFIFNLSIDEIGEMDDEIRGVKGNFNKSVDVLKKLKEIKTKNISVGIHTVISRFNVKRFKEIYFELIKLNPDSYITEIAEQRNELMTIDKDIVPEERDYIGVIDFLLGEINAKHFQGVGRLTKAIRIEYYNILKRSIIQKKEIIPCYAGITTAHITPDGNVWFCCVKAESIGNLRDTGFNFKKIWMGERAEKLREDIKNTSCYCPLANMAYTNIMMSYPALFKVGIKYIFG